MRLFNPILLYHWPLYCLPVLQLLISSIIHVDLVIY